MDEPKPAEPVVAAPETPAPAEPVSAPVEPVKPAAAAGPKPGVMDVIAKPAAEKTDDKTAPAETDKKPDVKATVPPKPKGPKNPNTGMAITATVIIVLGLAALATYAYLKSR